MNEPKWKMLIWLVVAILALVAFAIKAHFLSLLGRSFSN